MSTTLTELKRSRGQAKGTITRIARETRNLGAVTCERHDASLADKHLEIIGKADDAFRTQHLAILEADSDYSESQYEEELADHRHTYGQLRDHLQGIRQRFDASEVMAELIVSLEDLELSMADGYSTALNADLEGAEALALKLRRARAKPAVGESPDFKAASDKARQRLLPIQKARETDRTSKDAEAHASAEAATSRVTPPTPKTRKMKLPNFDGEILNWREFWNLFASLLRKEPHLSDEEKQAHLIGAMSNPECKAKAESAFAYTKTYDDAVVRLRQAYERNRVLHAHYVTNAIKPARFRNEKEDLEKLADRIERNLTGIELAKGLTALQVFATIFESFMEPCLVSEWRKYSEDQSDPPTTDDMVTFLWKQIRSAPDTPLDRRHRETPSKSRPHTKPSRTTVLRTQLSVDKCVYCHADHTIFSCTVQTDVCPTASGLGQGQ